MQTPRFVKSPILPWVLLGLVIATALAWWIAAQFGAFQDHAPRRWAKATLAPPSDEYGSLIAAGKASPNPIDWSKPHLAAYTVAAVAPPQLHPTLRDLAEKAQARAIDLLGQHLTDAAKSWTALQNALIDPAQTKPGEADPFRLDRVLVATVSKGTEWSAGDRMMWTRIFIQPINFRFAGYTVAATDNQTVTVSTVEATSTRKLSADVALTIPGVEGPKLGGGPSDEHTVKTTSDLTAQYERLGVDIKPDFLRIIRESGTGGDVVGNTAISLSVVTDPLLIQHRALTDQPAKPLGDELVLLVTDVDADAAAPTPDGALPGIAVLPQVPVPHCPLLAHVWMLYETRRIDQGGAFYDEARQDVSLIRDADDEHIVEMVDADEVSPAVWRIRVVPSGKTAPDSEAEPSYLQGSVNGGTKRTLVFTDYGKVIQFAHWLRVHAPGDTGQAATLTMQGGVSVQVAAGTSFVPEKKGRDECAASAQP